MGIQSGQQHELTINRRRQARRGCQNGRLIFDGTDGACRRGTTVNIGDLAAVLARRVYRGLFGNREPSIPEKPDHPDSLSGIALIAFRGCRAP